jgi:hypothetical protein
MSSLRAAVGRQHGGTHNGGLGPRFLVFLVPGFIVRTGHLLGSIANLFSPHKDARGRICAASKVVRNALGC